MDSTIRSELQKRRRRRRLRMLRNLFIVLFVVGSVYEGWSYVHDPDFAFGDIQISGTRKLTGDDILKMSEERRPINIINLNASRVENAIRHDVRFVSATCRYEWPGIFHVTVVERSPAIYVSDNYGSYVKIDYEGIIMSITKGVPDSTAPVLLKESLENSFVGDKVNNERILLVLKFMNGLSFEACSDLAQISIDEYNNLQMVLKTGVKMVVGALGEAYTKAPTYMTIYNEIKGKVVDVEYVDMRFNKPYIRLRQGHRTEIKK